MALTLTLMAALSSYIASPLDLKSLDVKPRRGLATAPHVADEAETALFARGTEFVAARCEDGRHRDTGPDGAGERRPRSFYRRARRATTLVHASPWREGPRGELRTGHRSWVTGQAQKVQSCGKIGGAPLMPRPERTKQALGTVDGRILPSDLPSETSDL